MDKDKAKAALVKSVDVLKELGLVHFLDQGTLLGAVRSGRFLEWDKDIDLGLFLNGCNAGDLCGALLVRGFSVEWFLTYGGGMSAQLAMEVDGIRVDFHCYEWDDPKGEVWHYSYIPMFYVGKNVFPRALFERFEGVWLEGGAYQAPSPVTEFLGLRYGNWRRVKRDWDYMKEPPCLAAVYESKVERC